VQVVVSVVDINDNSPSFPQRRVSVEVSEGAALGTRLPLPAAVDRDHAQYSVQRYELTEQSAMFRLETDDAGDEVWLTLGGRLDRERQSTYSLIVNAFDGGTPPNSAALDVQVCTVDSTTCPSGHRRSRCTGLYTGADSTACPSSGHRRSRCTGLYSRLNHLP